MDSFRFAALFALCVTGCSGDSNAVDTQDVGADVAAEDSGGDLAPAEDGGTGTDMPADGGCSDCFNVVVALDGRGLELDRAFFGITEASLTESGETELHIEAHRGGGTTCPDENSPSPTQTVIITNVKVPSGAGVSQSEAENLAVSYLDFAAELTTEVVLPATGEMVTWGTYTPEELEMDLNAALEGGSIEGHIIATHCDSMDLNP